MQPQATTQPRPNETARAWDSVAAGYDEWVTPTNQDLGRRALAAAGLESGDRFLDVGAGSGGLSLPAARLGASVVATDLAGEMLGRLERRAAADGLDGRIETRHMNGMNLDLDDGAFDVAGSQFAVMLFPDMPKGLREMVRVTRDGGRVVVVAMGPPSQIEFLTFFLGAIESVVPDFGGFPGDAPPLEFQLADPEELRRQLETAGLGQVEVDPTHHDLRFDSADHMWSWVTGSNPIGAGLVANLSDTQRSAVKRRLGEMLAERADGDWPAVLSNRINIGTGTK